MKAFCVFALVVLLTIFIPGRSACAQDPDPCCGDLGMLDKSNSLEEALRNRDSVICLDLSMQDVKLTAVPGEVAQLPNLLCLNVGFNRISLISAEISKLTRLRCIDLSGNQYLQDLPEFLNNMPSLQVIKLEDMRLWSAAKKEHIKQKFTNVHIIY